ncbi:hypothetical protein [Allopontixanthobacter sediminis]|uniref:Uncharacterized protein n=1 Tax=Allopontixanthobacter sediminis TaxID=1689985 RepID=A0A845B3B1_9SPHN|nr:hypothetical protein [Allopontixanthobacter sediminis]MXP44838.1 hypothetical protein [Allopontixanthobacter sediminis]
MVPLAKTRLEVPLIAEGVIADLRKGCLTSLAEYLRVNRGIPDSRIAAELCELIAGKPSRTKYRVLVIEAPRKKGAPSKTPGKKPTKTQLAQSASFRMHVELGDKPQFAAENAAEKKNTTAGAILRSVNAVEEYEQYTVAQAEEHASREAKHEQVQVMREAALAALRDDTNAALAGPESDKCRD